MDRGAATCRGADVTTAGVPGLARPARWDRVKAEMSPLRDIVTGDATLRAVPLAELAHALASTLI